MGWNFEEIEGDWLAGSHLAVAPDVIIESFNRADQLLGSEGIQNSRVHSGSITIGSGPTLRIVTIGQQLTVLRDLPKASRPF